MRIIGMMSGTSFDSVDAAAADFHMDGDQLVIQQLGLVCEPYPEALKEMLRRAMPPQRTSFEAVCKMDTAIGQAFARLASRANRELCDGSADVVASHGQTVYHWVEDGTVHGTLQIGQPAWIAQMTGCTVVSDFRPRDVAAGGQGAPLVSLFDHLWLSGQPGRPVALNLGGIANITVVDGDRSLAFDTGPANALLDAAIAHFTGGAEGFDRDGIRAARGRVHDELLTRLLAEPYYDLPAPKTTGKELFHLPYVTRALEGLDVGLDDLLATLTRLTARTVADQIKAVSGDCVLAAGGGVRNPTLMAMLRAELGDDIPIRTTDEAGLRSETKEALAFAFLGYLTVHGLPGTLPSCTGARSAEVLGSITPGTSWPLALHRIPAPSSIRLL